MMMAKLYEIGMACIIQCLLSPGVSFHEVFWISLLHATKQMACGSFLVTDKSMIMSCACADGNSVTVGCLILSYTMYAVAAS
jgi:hypothetical protein